MRAVERAPHLSTALVVVASLVVATLLATRVGPMLSVVVAVSSGAAFATSLWLVDRERWRVPAFVVAGTLSLFVGAGVAVAVGLTVLDMVSRLYPVAEVSQLRPRGLRLVSATLVVLGATVAVVGALASLGSILRRETARAYASMSVKTFVVPLAVATLLVAPTISARAGFTPVDPVLDPVVAAVDGAIGALFQPRPRRTHAFTFLLLWLATLLALSRGLARAPVAALSDGPRRDRARAVVERVRTRCRHVAIVLALLLVPSLFEFVASQFVLRQSLGPLYGLIVAVTAAHWLRTLAFLLIVAAVTLAAVTEGLGAIAGTTPRELAVASTPFVGGATVVVLVFLAHGPVIELATSFVADSLPSFFALTFERRADEIVFFFGSAAVGMVLAAGLVGLTALGSLALAIGATMGSLPDRATGPALAAAGLFVAAAFAAGAGVDPPLVVAGLVTSFLVWDAGEFGATVGQEVGASHARGPVVTHLGGTLAVGGLLAIGVWTMRGVAGGLPVVTGPALPVAFAVVVVGLALTGVALR